MMYESTNSLQLKRNELSRSWVRMPAKIQTNIEQEIKEIDAELKRRITYSKRIDNERTEHCK